jgi:hypothetical protein
MAIYERVPSIDSVPFKTAAATQAEWRKHSHSMAGEVHGHASRWGLAVAIGRNSELRESPWGPVCVCVCVCVCRNAAGGGAKREAKVNNTRPSRLVPDDSTARARASLASEFGRVPAISGGYGRLRKLEGAAQNIYRASTSSLSCAVQKWPTPPARRKLAR